jgi:hypothetical protein
MMLQLPARRNALTMTRHFSLAQSRRLPMSIAASIKDKTPKDKTSKMNRARRAAENPSIRNAGAVHKHFSSRL